MKAAKIRQQLHDYIDVVDEKKLKAIYTIVEEDMHLYVSKWDDEEFVNELKRRSASILDGSAETATWEEVKRDARKALADKKAKHNA